MKSGDPHRVLGLRPERCEGEMLASRPTGVLRITKLVQDRHLTASPTIPNSNSSTADLAFEPICIASRTDQAEGNRQPENGLPGNETSHCKNTEAYQKR